MIYLASIQVSSTESSKHGPAEETEMSESSTGTNQIPAVVFPVRPRKLKDDWPQQRKFEVNWLQLAAQMFFITEDWRGREEFI